jgi:hypothetical protein
MFWFQTDGWTAAALFCSINWLEASQSFCLIFACKWLWECAPAFCVAENRFCYALARLKCVKWGFFDSAVLAEAYPVAVLYDCEFGGSKFTHSRIWESWVSKLQRKIWRASTSFKAKIIVLQCCLYVSIFETLPQFSNRNILGFECSEYALQSCMHITCPLIRLLQNILDIKLLVVFQFEDEILITNDFYKINL